MSDLNALSGVDAVAAHTLPPARVRTRQRPVLPPSEAPNQQTEAPPAEKEAYEIGYKKPPRHSRFKPGQSGNSKGRPKKAKSLNTIVREHLTQKVPVRTANGEKKISRIEAVLHKTLEQAMKGNPRALAELIKLYASAVPEEKADHDLGQHDEDLTATDLAILEAYRAQFEQGGGVEP
jgi:hypothetical protein